MLCLTSLQLTAFAPGQLALGRRSAPRNTPVVEMRELKKIAVGVVGTGLVGSELLQQIEGCKKQLAAQGLEITVASISKTKPDADGERQRKLRLLDEYNALLDKVVHGGGVR